ncbi:MAG: tetratricopeptide repeat protein, partial [Planctomycetota bacterium]
APQRAEGHTLMSLWHHRRGNSLAALDTISNAIDREPTDVMALTFRSMILEDLGRFDEAKQSLAKALDIEPGNPNALAMLGRLQSGAFATVPVD